MIITGFSQYDIDEHGNIVDIMTNQPVKQYFNQYWKVTLTSDNNHRVQMATHALVAAAFMPEHKSNQVVSFKDGDKTNVQLSNLIWLTRHELSSIYYKRDHKPKPNNTNTEETRAMVLNALEAYEEPVNMIELSNALQVPYTLVRYSIAQLIEERKVTKTKEGYSLT